MQFRVSAKGLARNDPGKLATAKPWDKPGHDESGLPCLIAIQVELPADLRSATIRREAEGVPT